MGDVHKFSFAAPATRSALVVAHPGHELLVHNWLEVARPRVFVFTDGSGRGARSRLDSTTRILNQTDALPGSIYGRLSDAAAYSAIINHEFDIFTTLADELAAAFVADDISQVAADAVEGYNPMHDVCRLVVNAAVEVASRALCRPIANYAFSLVGQPLARAATPHPHSISLHLDDAAFTRKMAAAEGYAEMREEVFAALERDSIDAFRIERLHAVQTVDDECCGDKEQPFYERHGERQVATGYYKQVLRYEEHIAPLADALSVYAENER
jgi:hypothetical protein